MHGLGRTMPEGRLRSSHPLKSGSPLGIALGRIDSVASLRPLWVYFSVIAHWLWVPVELGSRSAVDPQIVNLKVAGSIPASPVKE